MSLDQRKHILIITHFLKLPSDGTSFNSHTNKIPPNLHEHWALSLLNFYQSDKEESYLTVVSVSTIYFIISKFHTFW